MRTLSPYLRPNERTTETDSSFSPLYSSFSPLSVPLPFTRAALGVPLTEAETLAYEMPNASELSLAALAYVRARNADPMCSFGDFAALSDVVDVATAKVMKIEVCDGIIAPGFEPEALEILKAKKKGAFIVLQVQHRGSSAGYL